MKKIIIALACLSSISAGAAVFSVQETLSRSDKSPWHYSFFSLASTEFGEQEKGGGRFSTYNYFTLARRLNYNTKLALRLPFQYSTYGYSDFNGDQVQDQEIFLQDVFVSLTKYNLGLLPGEIEVYWEGRFYIPTSEHSQNTKMITRLRNHFILSKYLSRDWVMEYDQKFNYYHQSRSTYRNQFTGSDGYEVDAISLTKRYKVDHWLQVWRRFRFNSYFGLGWKLGHEYEEWNSSEAENKTKPVKDVVKTGPSVRFALTSNINFIFSVEDKVNLKGEMSEFGQFKAKNLNLVLLSFVRF